MTRHILLALATLCALSHSAAVFAEEIVLTVQAAAPVAEPQSFDIAALEALPQQSFETSTVWTDGVQTFSGPAVKAVLDSLGLTGTTVHARALNDYVIEIPVETLEDGAPIIATRINGQPFSRREKGPLWIVYPYDSAPRFQTESVYGRSIWQLNALRLE